MLARDFIEDVKELVPAYIDDSSPINPVAICKDQNAHSDSGIRNIQVQNYIYAGRDEKDTKASLIALVSFLVENNTYVGRPFCKVDLFTGRVIESWDGLDKVAIRKINTSYKLNAGPGGNFKIGEYFYDGTEMPKLDVKTDSSETQCRYENDLVVTSDLKQQMSGGEVFVVDCTKGAKDRINGGYSSANDAHHFGSVVFAAYQKILGTAPLQPPLLFRVHYGQGYENAFWDGETMTFGDGQSRFYPLVSLDVVAHEVSHGFTEKNSNLEYQLQSGGINEAFSDMAGETVEFFSRGSNDFLVGFDIMKDPQGALRYMCNPPEDGKSIDHADEYVPSLNVHHSSGVYNKAFCNLAKTEGWTTQTAFMVFADANRNYWTPTTDFNQGACGVENAAADRHYTVADVSAAFETVGIYCL